MCACIQESHVFMRESMSTVLISIFAPHLGHLTSSYKCLRLSPFTTVLDLNFKPHFLQLNVFIYLLNLTIFVVEDKGVEPSTPDSRAKASNWFLLRVCVAFAVPSSTCLYIFLFM